MQFYNVKININIEDEGEFLGEGFAKISLDTCRALLECELSSSLRYELESYLEDEGAYYLSTDIYISIIAVLTEQLADKEWTIDITVPHPVWLIHDLQHVIRDANEDGREIYVDEYAESEAWNNTLQVYYHYNMPIPFSVLAEAQRAFVDRFGNSCWYLENALNNDTDIEQSLKIIGTMVIK